MSDEFAKLDKRMRDVARSTQRREFIHAYWYNLWIGGLLSLVATFLLGAIWFSPMPHAVKCLLSAVVIAATGTLGTGILAGLDHENVADHLRPSVRRANHV